MTEERKKRPSVFQRFGQNLRAQRERRGRGELTRGERTLAKTRSGIAKGREFLKKGQEFSRKYKLSAKSRGGKSPGEYLGQELRKGANNAPLIGTMTRKKGIRNQ